MATVLRSLTTLSSRSSATTAGIVSRRLICNAASDHHQKLAKNSGGTKTEVVSATVNSEVQIVSWGRLFGLAVITFFSCKLGGRYANYQYERSLFEGFQKSKQEMSTPQL
ncbi:Os07g0114600 [Oryza sativa Japonica Group]|uniref:Os07g0114600 protein n=5 Tax=Oryza TaxID=4527 RepID=A0A0P0X1V8_ORYSJ|nr:hypothetical protein OsJ_22869 [Oryza sativa Japonica Group]BAC16189.1 hypothetical protein [Oryza sativa Japonica Group]BAS99795.1 Os07g0114600 [Oryza sativa Japonica Group]